jgi:hypothetical protein
LPDQGLTHGSSAKNDLLVKVWLGALKIETGESSTALEMTQNVHIEIHNTFVICITFGRGCLGLSCSYHDGKLRPRAVGLNQPNPAKECPFGSNPSLGAP